jgi:hypothetical protein
MKLILVVMTLFLSVTTFGGPGGGHSHGHSHSHVHISKSKSQSIARKHVERLVKAKKIESSWLKSKFDKSIKKKFSGKLEWVVTFTNASGVKGKKKLYIFLKESGDFVAANFSGN